MASSVASVALADRRQRERESHRKSHNSQRTNLQKITPGRIKHQAGKCRQSEGAKARWYPSLRNNLAASSSIWFPAVFQTTSFHSYWMRAWRALPHLSETKFTFFSQSSSEEFWSWSGYAAWICWVFQRVFPYFCSLFLFVPIVPSSTWTLVPLPMELQH